MIIGTATEMKTKLGQLPNPELNLLASLRSVAAGAITDNMRNSLAESLKPVVTAVTVAVKDFETVVAAAFQAFRRVPTALSCTASSS
jgi:hypothetical protein